MSYQFTDTTALPRSDIPAEAVYINGELIEDQIDGYRTLYVSGREALSPDLSTEDIGSRSGTFIRSKRYPARTITVGYQLIAESPEKFRAAYNQLASILDQNQAKFIFADEPDKYFIGTVSEIGEIDPGRNAVTGTFSILCDDPYKYSNEEYTEEMSSDGSLSITNLGTVPSYPEVEIRAKSELGYFSISDSSGNTIKTGKAPEYGDTSESQGDPTPSETILNMDFRDGLGSWVSGGAWATSIQNKRYSPVQTGTMSCSDEYGLYCSKYPSENNYSGAAVTYTLSDPVENFTFDWHHEISTESIRQAEETKFIVQGTDSSGADCILAETHYYNITGSTIGSVRLSVMTTALTTMDLFDISDSDNGVTGHRTGRSSITKDGTTFYFTVAGKTYSYTVAAASGAKATKLSIYMGKYINAKPAAIDRVYSVAFMKNNESYENIPNQIHEGDLIEIDSSSGLIRQNGVARYDLGNVENAWEDFTVTPGKQTFSCIWSSWAEQPDVTLKYRRRYR